MLAQVDVFVVGVMTGVLGVTFKLVGVVDVITVLEVTCKLVGVVDVMTVLEGVTRFVTEFRIYICCGEIRMQSGFHNNCRFQLG